MSFCLDSCLPSSAASSLQSCTLPLFGHISCQKVVVGLLINTITASLYLHCQWKAQVAPGPVYLCGFDSCLWHLHIWKMRIGQLSECSGVFGDAAVGKRVCACVGGGWGGGAWNSSACAASSTLTVPSSFASALFFSCFPWSCCSWFHSSNFQRDETTTANHLLKFNYCLFPLVVALNGENVCLLTLRSPRLGATSATGLR